MIAATIGTQAGGWNRLSVSECGAPVRSGWGRSRPREPQKDRTGRRERRSAQRPRPKTRRRQSVHERSVWENVEKPRIATRRDRRREPPKQNAGMRKDGQRSSSLGLVFQPKMMRSAVTINGMGWRIQAAQESVVVAELHSRRMFIRQLSPPPRELRPAVFRCAARPERLPSRRAPR